jgi:hypothetical protein
MFCHVYWNTKTGEVLVASVARTEAGYWLDIEPVERASADDPSSLLSALKKTVATKGGVIPTPTRSAFPKPVVLAYAKAKSWSDFERRYSQFSVAETPDRRYQIEGYRRASEGAGVEVDPEVSKVLVPEALLEDVVTELVSLMRQASHS